jgi:hypothetical protein
MGARRESPADFVQAALRLPTARSAPKGQSAVSEERPRRSSCSAIHPDARSGGLRQPNIQDGLRERVLGSGARILQGCKRSPRCRLLEGSASDTAYFASSTMTSTVPSSASAAKLHRSIMTPS